MHSGRPPLRPCTVPAKTSFSPRHTHAKPILVVQLASSLVVNDRLSSIPISFPDYTENTPERETCTASTSPAAHAGNGGESAAAAAKKIQQQKAGAGWRLSNARLPLPFERRHAKLPAKRGSGLPRFARCELRLSGGCHCRHPRCRRLCTAISTEIFQMDPKPASMFPFSRPPCEN